MSIGPKKLQLYDQRSKAQLREEARRISSSKTVQSIHKSLREAIAFGAVGAPRRRRMYRPNSGNGGGPKAASGTSYTD